MAEPAWVRVTGRFDLMGLAWRRGIQGRSDWKGGRLGLKAEEEEEGRFEPKAIHKPDSMVSRILQLGRLEEVQYVMVLRSFL